MQDNYFTSATVWMIVWLLIGAVVTIASSLLTARTLFPEFASRCADRCATPVRAFFLGLLTAAAAAILVAFAAKAGKIGQPFAFIIIGCVSLLALAGVSGQIVRMARAAHDGESPNSWAASRRAATILTLSYILPVAGWVVILPLSLLTGLGCAIMSLRLRVRVAGPVVALVPASSSPPPVPAFAKTAMPPPLPQPLPFS